MFPSFISQHLNNCNFLLQNVFYFFSDATLPLPFYLQIYSLHGFLYWPSKWSILSYSSSPYFVIPFVLRIFLHLFLDTNVLNTHTPTDLASCGFSPQWYTDTTIVPISDKVVLVYEVPKLEGLLWGLNGLKFINHLKQDGLHRCLS